MKRRGESGNCCRIRSSSRRNGGIVFVATILVVTLYTIHHNSMDIAAYMFDSSLSSNSTQSYYTASTSGRLSNNTTVRLKIAILTGFVYPNGTARISSSGLDHIINKACYANRHGYDFIFNSTWAFTSEETTNNSWLKYGHWHRVPHIQSILPRYDWVLYCDTDWLAQDFSHSLEAFIQAWERRGKRNVSVFLPVDFNRVFTFSSYAVMIRNSLFGRRLVENWMRFALGGVCKSGKNFPIVEGEYHWGDSDQPGLWYALAQTYAEFNQNSDHCIVKEIRCNETSGYLETESWLGKETNDYFQRVGAKLGAEGTDLDNVPDGQPILWSQIRTNGLSGLGVQKEYGHYMDPSATLDAFAIHSKENLSVHPNVAREVQNCKVRHGCSAGYDLYGQLEAACDGTDRSPSSMRQKAVMDRLEILKAKKYQVKGTN